MKISNIVTTLLVMLVSGGPTTAIVPVFGKEYKESSSTKATTGAVGGNNKSKQMQGVEESSSSFGGGILIVCQNEHEDECKSEIESVEGVEIVNPMVHTRNMFAMRMILDDDNDDETEDNIAEKMSELEALPHVQEVEEDRFVKFDKTTTTTTSKVMNGEQLHHQQQQQQQQRSNTQTKLDKHELPKKLKDAFQRQYVEGRRQNRGLRNGAAAATAAPTSTTTTTTTTKIDGQEVPYGIYQTNAPQMWEAYSTKGAGVIVCVIDSGVSNTHEDFNVNNLSGNGLWVCLSLTGVFLFCFVSD